MFTDEAHSRILREADRIMVEAESLLTEAIATGDNELIEAARKNLRQVTRNRDRLDRVFFRGGARARARFQVDPRDNPRNGTPTGELRGAEG